MASECYFHPCRNVAEYELVIDPFDIDVAHGMQCFEDPIPMCNRHYHEYDSDDISMWNNRVNRAILDHVITIRPIGSETLESESAMERDRR